jgi:hypothetical protein
MRGFCVFHGLIYGSFFSVLSFLGLSVFFDVVEAECEDLDDDLKEDLYPIRLLRL